tara:strand:- start:180 stop:290 length:111 start_codon:yes stop_codon:yes gene_type:complete
MTPETQHKTFFFAAKKIYATPKKVPETSSMRGIFSI